MEALTGIESDSSNLVKIKEIEIEEKAIKKIRKK